MYFVSQKYIFLILIRNCFPYAIIFHNILQLISVLAKDRKWNKIFFVSSCILVLKKSFIEYFAMLSGLFFKLEQYG